MPYNRDAAAPYRVRTDCSELAELGVKVPKSVTAALATLNNIGKPIQPTSGAMAAAVLAGADEAELHRLALAELAFEKVRDAHGRATLIAADAVAEALRESHNDLHAQLAKLAQAAIDKLTAAAAIDLSLDALVRAGRHADAEVVAAADITVMSLAKLYRTRERLLWPRGNYPSADVTEWRTPEHAGRGYVDGIRDGGQLWFPTFTEACERAQELDDTRRRAEGAVLADA